MKRIGNGWQYAVYDLGNGRVLKKFHSWGRACFFIIKDIFPFNKDSLFKIPGFIRGVKEKAEDSFVILKSGIIPSEWIANPKFVNEYDFEQDKVIPLHDLFENLNTEEIKKVIDEFIVFNKKMLDLGVIDKGFNITRNYGVNSKGEIVLIDIGELFNDKEMIEKQLRSRAWDKSYVSGRIKDKEAEKYFVEQMDKNFWINK